MPGGSVHVSARVEGEWAQIEVRDTGIGIAEDEQERIFEAFQRGGRDARTSTEGTGLGLTLSKRIVELHGGRMWMQSQLGMAARLVSPSRWPAPTSHRTSLRPRPSARDPEDARWS